MTPWLSNIIGDARAVPLLTDILADSPPVNITQWQFHCQLDLELKNDPIPFLEIWFYILPIMFLKIICLYSVLLHCINLSPLREL